MPQITVTTIADIMRRGIETASGKWLESIEPIECVSAESPWYADPQVYANPFAIRVKTTTSRPFVFTRGDFADGMAAIIADSGNMALVQRLIDGRYTNSDAETFLRLIVASQQY
jgi:hypothetical protein